MSKSSKWDNDAFEAAKEKLRENVKESRRESLAEVFKFPLVTEENTNNVNNDR